MIYFNLKFCQANESDEANKKSPSGADGLYLH